jgi:hypothetical protein
MSYRVDAIEKMEYYKGSELPTERLENAGNAQSSTAPGTRSAGTGQNGEEDTINREREEKLELWMETVKAFIRQIDVSGL